MAALFPLGQLVATPAALALLADAGENPAVLLARHVTGDWGEVSPEDARENELSVREGYRIVSSYPVGSGGGRVWLITQSGPLYDLHSIARRILDLEI